MSLEVKPATINPPHGYVLIVTHLHCNSCGHYAALSEFYELHLLKARFTDTSPVKHLIRCDSPKYNLPVTRQDAGSRKIPVCASCPKFDLSHLPDPPRPAAMHELVNVSYKTTVAKPTTPAKASVKPNIQDLA